MPAALVGLLQDALGDLDRVVADVDSGVAIAKPEGGSAIAWSVGHVTNQLDGWVNVRFAGGQAHPLIGARRFRDGDGRADDWPAILAGAGEVRAAALSYLWPLSDRDLVPT